MYIMNNAKQPMTYRAHGEVLVLKPGLNRIIETRVTSGELKAHFGFYVTVIEDNVEVKLEEPNVDILGEDGVVNKPEVCKACYEDGKTPSDDDCKKCDVNSNKEPEEQVKKAEVKVATTKKATTKKATTKKTNKKKSK